MICRVGRNTFSWVSLMCAAAFVVNGCAASKDSSVDRIVNQSSVTNNTPVLDLISYRWCRDRDVLLEVKFSTSGSNDGMSLNDGWSIYEQRVWPSHVWDISASRCSKVECVQMIDRSLTKFHTENPNVRLKMVLIESHIVRELWAEILTGLSQRLATLPGTTGKTFRDPVRGDSRADNPPEIGDEVERVLDQSTTIAAIKAVLRKHGMNMQMVGLARPFLFNDSNGGEQWSDIAKLPGVGIELPGVIEFDLVETSGTKSEGHVPSANNE